MVTAIVVRITKKTSDNDNDDDKKYDNSKDHDEEKMICSGKAADGGFCDGHSSHHEKSPCCKPSDDVIDEKSAVDINRHDTNNSKKRPLHLVKDKNETETKERGKKRPKFIDLTDVPPQSHLLKRSRKDGTSKYEGVSFNKAWNKWQAKISFDGKRYSVGYYDNEEKAAIDYARAVSKYKGGKKGKPKFIDLTDVPPQSPLLKSSSKDGASKYLGVYFDKASNKWVAMIYVDGKNHRIGYYDNEEEAAIDYARAVSKYKGGKKGKPKFIDLTDVPPQSPILKSNGMDGASKYEGVFFKKATNKWQAQISVDGKNRHIGYYDDEEEAAGDYARAVSKYKGEKKVEPKFIDLTDVPPQSPILKSNGMDGASKYLGVSFNKASNKWQAMITVDGKKHHIGVYHNEEKAAIDFARAVSKYTTATRARHVGIGDDDVVVGKFLLIPKIVHSNTPRLLTFSSFCRCCSR
jgi:hypothetical protein